MDVYVLYLWNACMFTYDTMYVTGNEHVFINT